MKKIFIFLITLVVCMAVILPAGATEVYGSTVEGESVPEATEQETGAVTETTEGVFDTYTETIGGTVTETESADIMDILGDAESRLDAIAKIAAAMGITLDEAEALLDKMIALGDEHLGDSDIWADIKADILENPENWIAAALIVLMVVALIVFIIRGLIKNTSAQAAMKLNVVDIKKNQSEISEDVTKATRKLGDIENEHTAIKAEMDEIRALTTEMRAVVDAGKEETDRILDIAVAMLAAVELIKTNSESAVKVNEEQALRTVQLLNIAMGRQLPRVSEATRKVWYEDSVAKIKEAAGDKGTEAQDG